MDRRMVVGRCLWASLVVGLAVAALCGCQRRPGEPATAAAAPAREEGLMNWSLTSPAFSDGDRIPSKFTCEGEDVSPELRWTDPPSGTVTLALICEDPDAPRGTWMHWVLYNLPAGVRTLPEAVPKSEVLAKLGGAKQGKNSGGTIGYQGPCPPSGPAHHYHFRLWALDAPVSLNAGASAGELRKAMEGHVVGETELVGLYSR